MCDVMIKLLRSWSTSNDDEYNDILNWVQRRNAEVVVNIKKNKLSESGFWYYDSGKGEITNKNNSFFTINGMRQTKDGETVLEQPVIIQNEIGYLGILSKEMNGVLYFLMQAKIEPGNINNIQISPTIQATKSNFTQKHGGKKPAYLDLFLNSSSENIIVDQIQSEQSSRFFGKRNRNIVVITDDEIELTQNHRWMTLGTIKRLMKTDNLVNMDTRTVISCLPFSMYDYTAQQSEEIKRLFTDSALYNSIFGDSDNEDFIRLYHYINDYKMLQMPETALIPLDKLSAWEITDNEIYHKDGYAFKVVFCDIEIEGREVTYWTQPLFEATGKAFFGLLCTDFNGKRKFLVHAKSEAGCFDGIELAPTVQLEASVSDDEYNDIDKLFFSITENGSRVLNDVILSEEGGRFYHEENRNIIILVNPDEIPKLPEDYFWLDFRTLNHLVQFNNVLNIQLRNLLSLLEM